MAKRRKSTKITSPGGIRLGDLLPDQPGDTEAKPAKPPKKDRLQERVDEMKLRASQENVPWSQTLEDELRACKTGGAVKRLWKAHRVKHGA